MMPSYDEAKTRLEAERARLQAEITEVAARPASYAGTEDSYYGNHLADTATDIFEEEKAIALEAHLTGLLGKVEAALERIAQGTYGKCERCGKPIAPERLEALPSATTCVTCSSAGQQARGVGAP
jgi:RNA polymerase-binding protein DksA